MVLAEVDVMVRSVLDRVEGMMDSEIRVNVGVEVAVIGIEIGPEGTVILWTVFKDVVLDVWAAELDDIVGVGAIFAFDKSVDEGASYELSDY
jgi:hypothetical protein